MSLQQMTFLDEPDCKGSLVFRGGSLASRTAVQESAKLLVTNVIYGPNSGELLAKLDRRGLWLKMFGDFYQVRMDGSFSEFSETLPTWGTMWAGGLRAQPQLAPSIDVSGWRLLPTPIATDYKGGRTMVRQGATEKNSLRDFCRIALNMTYPSCKLCEIMMGFPPGWTDLSASETPSSHSSSFPSSKQ